jgi:hypothetical protein
MGSKVGKTLINEVKIVIGNRPESNGSGVPKMGIKIAARLRTNTAMRAPEMKWYARLWAGVKSSGIG